MDAGGAAYAKPAFYSTQGGPIDNTAWFLERILASPDRTLKLLPGGEARATKLTTLKVGSGATSQEVTAWAITGLANTPIPMWSDARGRFFGFVFFLSWLPEAYGSEHSRLNEAQNSALAAQGPALVKSLVKVPAGPVAFNRTCRTSVAGHLSSGTLTHTWAAIWQTPLMIPSASHRPPSAHVTPRARLPAGNSRPGALIAARQLVLRDPPVRTSAFCPSAGAAVAARATMMKARFVMAVPLEVLMRLGAAPQSRSAWSA